jgi:cobalamin biosynthesis Mg chelatase CobN
MLTWNSCYQKHCSNEKNPVEKEIQECDRVGARNSTGAMSDSSNKEEDPESPQPENKSFDSSTSDASTNPSSSAAERGGSTSSAAAAAASTAANQPSAAVSSTACSIFSMTLGMMALVMVRVLDWI